MQLLAVGQRPGLGLGKLEAGDDFIRALLPPPALSFKFQSHRRPGSTGRPAPAFLSCQPRGGKLMVDVFT